MLPPFDSLTKLNNQEMTAGELLKNANQLQRCGNIDEAITLYKKAIELNPNFSWSYYFLGEALVRNDRVDEALQFYNKALHLNFYSKTLRYEYGNILSKLGKLEAAINCWSNLLYGSVDFPKFINDNLELNRVKYVKQKVCFVHIPKTGGTSIINALYGSLDRVYHKSIRDHKFKNNQYRFSIIRNPFSFYVSLYSFILLKGSFIKNPLKSLSQIKEFKEFLFVVTSSQQFKKYIGNKKNRVLPQDYNYMSDKLDVGLFSHYYLYFCFDRASSSMRDIGNILQPHDEYFSLSKVLKVEELSQDFPALMKEWKIPILELGKKNVSPHKKWQEYYDKEMIDRVLYKDRLIFELYYPDFFDLQ